jgi:hypothetical protein
VFLGNGIGGFGSGSVVGAGVIPRTVQFVDLNCDGFLDLLVSSSTENKVGWAFGKGDGSFATATLLDLSPHQAGITQAVLGRDVDFDGTIDLLVGSTQSPAYLVFPNVSP